MSICPEEEQVWLGRCLYVRNAIDDMGRYGFGRLHLLGLDLRGNVKDKAIVGRKKTLGFLRRLFLLHILRFSLLSI